MIAILVWLGIGVMVAILAAGFVASYAQLATLRSRVDDGWSQIGSRLTERHDSIGRLAHSATSLIGPGSSALADVASALEAANGADPAAERSRAENELTAAAERLRRCTPPMDGWGSEQTEAAAAYAGELEESRSIDTRVCRARQSYNDAVMTYNTARLTFPNNVVGAIAGFGEREYFEFEGEGAERLEVG